MPFEVPEGWCWCRLDEVADVARGGSPRPIKQYLTDSPDGVNWIKIGDTTEGSKYIEKTVEKIIPEGVRHSRMVKEGDFLLTNSMSFGKPFILKTNGCIHDGWLVISPFEGSFDKDYLYYLLSSGFAYDQFSDKASGAVVSNLNKDKVAESLFPLPPFEEQKKIVCQIESIMNFIDRMENNLEDVSTLVDRCKSRILNLAIHGKLVQQDANDEPASELLKRINPKAIASCDNPHYEQVPFVIPDSWAWVKLENINVFKSKSVNPFDNPSETYELYSVPTFETGEPEFPHGKDIASSKVVVSEGDVLLCKINPHLNRVWVVRQRKPQLKALASSEWIVIRVSEILPEYLELAMQSPYFRELMQSNVSGVGGSLMRAQPTFVKQYMVPVPPIQEQIRIVKRIQETFHMLDSIGESLC